MIKRQTVELWVGLFVLVGIAALLMMAIKVSGLQTSFKSTQGYQVKAYFDNIGGLKTRAKVTAAGVNVGRVQAINFDETTYRAEVVLYIFNGFRFPADSSASILTSGLIGDNYISLTPGAEEVELATGDIIEETHSALVLERLIGQFLFDKDKT